MTKTKKHQETPKHVGYLMPCFWCAPPLNWFCYSSTDNRRSRNVAKGRGEGGEPSQGSLPSIQTAWLCHACTVTYEILATKHGLLLEVEWVVALSSSIDWCRIWPEPLLFCGCRAQGVNIFPSLHLCIELGRRGKEVMKSDGSIYPPGS